MRMAYKESDLVLKVSNNVNPEVWNEGFYQVFLDLLFKNRDYQKKATETVLRYLNSGEYKNLEELAKENFDENDVIRERFNGNFESMKKELPLFDKLSATVDLATGTGKSYVMIALALIMLASKKVNRVLVLTPSITIEEGLTKKFREALSNEKLLKSLGPGFIPPEILNGDSTIVENSIAIENRDAIYSAQENRNSIIDSLSGNGETTLVLNDEAHHVYYSKENQWMSFIQDNRENNIKFKYVIGFTGTPYKAKSKSGSPNEYFSDIVYRYSLREAIEHNFVKDIQYISKEDIPNDKKERWQIILNSHDQIAQRLEYTLKEKPVTIIVSNTQKRADSQAASFKKFLKEQRKLSDTDVDEIVLSVHSGSKAAMDRLKLKNVDNKGNPVEFIFSVSMLTEGWDVKRVFQVVPDEERAFNSKLLIAQVLGRGLRRPNGWQSEWGVPTVIIFNHEKWSKNVKSLVDEILDLRKVLRLQVNPDSDYNFELTNIEYITDPTIVETLKMGTYKLWENGVSLPTDTPSAKSNITFTNVKDGSDRTIQVDYAHEVIDIDDMAGILYHRFEDLEDTENGEEYKRIWPISRIKHMIEDSLRNSSNKVITKSIKNRFLSSMGTIFREGAKSVSYETNPSVYFKISTNNLPIETYDLLNFKKNRTLFYCDELRRNLSDDESVASFKEIIDTSNAYSQKEIKNKYLFKTPQYGVVTSGIPEKEFLKFLITPEVASKIDSFIKSPDMNFYHFDYTWRKGNHHKNGQFNPDWFIKQGKNYIVVETKDDAQITQLEPENIGKNKAALNHFNQLNNYFKEINSEERIKFTFLTPKNYGSFFETLKNGDILTFRSELDVALEK